MTVPLIAHLDSDAFYVAAERTRNHRLIGAPVGVLGNNGACVIAKSYELREYGVRTGEPIWEARRKCPEMISIKRDFRWYECVSQSLLSLLQGVSPTVEYYSIDEMFFDAGFLESHFKTNLKTAARALQHLVLERVGIPVSIGISTSKTLAKLGSDAFKPFGVAVLLESEVGELLKAQPIGEVCGIGHRSIAKLARHKIHTCHDFIQAPRSWIRNLLTVTGERLWFELRGESVLPILTERPHHKVVARGGSVGRAITTYEGVRAWGMRTLERLIEALESHNYVCGSLGCEIEFKESGFWSGKLNLEEDSADFETLYPVASLLMKKGWKEEKRVTHLHFIATRIGHRKRRQLSLFDPPPTKENKVNEVKKIINEKLGRFSLRSGATLLLPELYKDGSHDYEICDVAGKTCF